MASSNPAPASALRRAAFDPEFAAWRAAARRLLEDGISPNAVLWEPSGDEQPALDGFAEDTCSAKRSANPPPRGEGRKADSGTVRPSGEGGALVPHADGDADASPSARFRVPRRFFELAEAAACHADGERWALLYRVLWRTTHGEPHLLEVAVDPDVHRLLRMEKAVRREIHKLHAFVRFRAMAADDGETHYVAWFEPEHHVVERAAPFFVDRFPSMRWSILTPRRCAHWDGEALAFTPGLPRSAAPGDDALEALWRTYYASTFNPARVRTNAMRAEMPVRYWRNLPEAAQIGALVRDAPSRVKRMVEQQGLPPELARPAQRTNG